MFDEVVTVDMSQEPVVEAAREAVEPEGETIDDPQADIVTVPGFAALPPS